MAKKTEVERQRDIEISDCAFVMSNTSGRRFIYRMLMSCGTFSDGFNSDPHIHARNSGLRGAGLLMVSNLKIATPGEYKTMIEENEQ